MEFAKGLLESDGERQPLEGAAQALLDGEDNVEGRWAAGVEESSRLQARQDQSLKKRHAYPKPHALVDAILQVMLRTCMAGREP